MRRGGERRREMVPPPFRFGAVEADIFRSAQPTLKNYRFLSRLKLRTVVSIAPEGPMEDEAMFCREHAAQLVPVRAELYRDEAVTLSSQQVAQVLSILTNSDRLPALIHCPDGRVLTGVVLWCLRRLQCWDNQASAAEFTRFCGVLPTREVEKFVEGFGDEVTIPENVPCWLWGGDRAHWHPTIRIRHLPPLEVFEPDPLPSQKTLRGEMHARTDYLRVRRDYMHAHNKRRGGAAGGGVGDGTRGGGVSTGGQGITGPGTSARRRFIPSRPPTGPLSRQDSFNQDFEDITNMMDEEELGLPKLSRAVQALSLEGLEMGSQDVLYEEAPYGRQPQPLHQQRNSGGVQLQGGLTNSAFHGGGRRGGGGGDAGGVGGGNAS